MFSIIQQARGSITKTSKGKVEFEPDSKNGDLKLLGGSTLIFDLETKELKYYIVKPLVTKNRINMKRIINQYDFQNSIYQDPENEYAALFGLLERTAHTALEPFAILHNH